MAPHTVKHQDNNTQAVAGSMWRAEDSAERSRFVLPSGYLKRQQKTKQVVGGAGVRAAPGVSPAGTHAVCMALCKKRPLMRHGLNQAWGWKLLLLPMLVLALPCSPGQPEAPRLMKKNPTHQFWGTCGSDNIYPARLRALLRSSKPPGPCHGA